MPDVRLIDANALKPEMEILNAADMYLVCHIIDNTLTIEPEVRRGRWIFKKGDNKSTVDGWVCTSCKSGFHTKVPYFEVFKYCPMCGARMDGGADNG